ncbi:hypothetical protein AALO_G00128640 [Alosa alosa]|uniref:Uncharacterized protein n=1 Tax=Alosa alosa TaxID=278164 RepID=A0AAV6GR04_9TELE|nr:hypothetical protein AALO_G00128640 [Alosa alosa]
MQAPFCPSEGKASTEMTKAPSDIQLSTCSMSLCNEEENWPKRLTDFTLHPGEKMSEEVVRQTRSQKRALEKDAPPSEAERKRLKLEHPELGRAAATTKGSGLAVTQSCPTPPRSAAC